MPARIDRAIGTGASLAVTVAAMGMIYGLITANRPVPGELWTLVYLSAGGMLAMSNNQAPPPPPPVVPPVVLPPPTVSRTTYAAAQAPEQAPGSVDTTP